MNFEQFLEEYKTLNIKELTREQLHSFREIFYDNGMLDEALKISEVIFNNSPDEEESIVLYAENLLHLGMRDEALVVLFNSKKTAQTLLLEGIMYKEDMLLDVAEEKFKKALALVGDNAELKEIIDYELANVYAEVGKSDDALTLSNEIFLENPNVESFRNVLDNLIGVGRFEEAVEFYKNHGSNYDEAEVHFAVAFAYNQLHELDKSKEELLKTIQCDSEFVDAYMHLGHMSVGREAIGYLEKYLEFQGTSTNVYLHLTALYREEKEYDKIRNMVREVLSTMGIDFDTLYIAINALRNLYETEKIYKIYEEHSLIKEDSSLLALTLLALSEEEDYVDFVEKEIYKHHPFLKDEASYFEILNNVYEVTNSSDIKMYMDELENRNSGIYEQFHDEHHIHDDNCGCGNH